MAFWQRLMQKHASMTPRLVPASTIDPRERLKAIGLMALATLCFAVLFLQAEYGIRDDLVTGVQTCALPISAGDVAKAYLLAWELGCKGLTVYVTGSRKKEVLETHATAKSKETSAPVEAPKP